MQSGRENNKDQFNEFLQIEVYPNSMEGIVTSNDFLSILKSTIESPGNTIEPGQIPGEKSICGTVQSNRFRLRKSGAFANPFAKDIVGIVENAPAGSLIKYKLENRPVTTFFQTSVLVTIICIGLFSAMIFFASLNFVSASRIGITAFYAVGGPLLALIAFLTVCKVAESTGESDQEEVLDHIKKLAAGISVSS